MEDSTGNASVGDCRPINELLDVERYVSLHQHQHSPVPSFWRLDLFRGVGGRIASRMVRLSRRRALVVSGDTFTERYLTVPMTTVI